MFVTTCRRCGETAVTEKAGSPTIECAGEMISLCTTCYAQFRRWFAAPTEVPETAPELEEETAR
jgi:hypothetical protein